MAEKYPLDPELREFVDRCAALFDHQAAAKADADTQRRMYVDLCQAFEPPRPDGIEARDDAVASPDGDIPVRLYRPEGAGPLPLLIYFHGGGWVVGDLESHDTLCAEFAERSGAAVLAVAYRLAPEHPFPAAVDDGWHVLQTVAAEPDRFGCAGRPFAVGGDSAGAHIAVDVALRNRDMGNPPLAGQLLVYGAFGGDGSAPSFAENEDAPMLTAADVRHYHQAYFGDDYPPDDPYMAPLRAADLRAMPSAFVQAVEFDPLRDESVEYARRLDAAGVAVELRVEQGLVHGCMRARHMSGRAADMVAHFCDAVTRLLFGEAAGG